MDVGIWGLDPKLFLSGGMTAHMQQECLGVDFLICISVTASEAVAEKKKETCDEEDDVDYQQVQQKAEACLDTAVHDWFSNFFF